MRICALSLFAVSVIASSLNGEERQAELFAAWDKARREVQSLAVEFTVETRCDSLPSRQTARGTFRLLVTAQGTVIASYRVQPDAKTGKLFQPHGLLYGRTVYLLNSEKKIAFRFSLQENELQPFLEKHLNPFVRLLDQQRTMADCIPTIGKQDERYTYMMLKRKKLTVTDFGAESICKQPYSGHS